MAEVVLHLGAHGTDNGTIAAWLERNAATLARDGTLVMPSRRFLRRLSQSQAGLGDAPSDSDRRAFGDALGLGGHITRLAVSAPALLGTPEDAIASEGFYPRDATGQLRALGRLFPRDMSLTIAFAVARPGAFVTALLESQAQGADSPMIDEGIGWLQGETLPWARLVRKMRQELPRARLVIWRHESLPRIWPDVLSQFAGYREDAEHPLPVEGTEDFAIHGINEEGQRRMRRYIAEKPPPTAALMQRVAVAFMQGYGRRRVGGGIDLPGWLRTRLDQFDEGYAAQWTAIAAMDGVELLD